MGAIFQNFGTVLVCFILAIIVALIILVLRRDKRAGKSTCGSCGACPMRDSCHSASDVKGVSSKNEKK